MHKIQQTRPSAMHNRFRALLLTSFAVSLAHAAQPAPTVMLDADGTVTNRLLVLPRAGVSPDNLASLLSPYGGKARRIGSSNLHVVDLSGNRSAKQVAAKLAGHPHLKFVELDRRVRSSFVPNDPYVGSEWHLNKVNAPAAWDRTSGTGVTIAVLDSGVDASHPDLMPNLVAGYNFVDNDTNTADVCGHGTAVAGTAAASSNNGIGVAGIAGKASIMPIRIAYLDTTSNGCYGYYSTIISGITYAADRGARVVNVSYGGLASSASVQNAALYLKGKGGLLFVSAGNNGVNENVSPTNSMIVVSATDTNDVVTSWSSFGSFVSLSAPGAGIWSTSKGGIYQQWSGTSFASPLTAGVAALVMAANPSLDNLSVESLLNATAVDLGSAGRDIYYGYGRVNAGAAVAAAVSKLVIPDTQAPTSSISAPLANATVSGLVPVDVAATDNVGVSRVELKVNGTLVATDTTAPFGFSWDSNGAANGIATLVATAYDVAGNSKASTVVAVNVANAVAAPVETWTTCASEGGVCNFINIRKVRYGANNSYAVQTANATIACNNNVFGDPMNGVVKTCQYSSIFTTATTPAPAPAPVVETWTACGNEGATCTFTGTRSVRYGANGIFATKVFTGATACTNGVFGDPIQGVVKACFYSSITQ